MKIEVRDNQIEPALSGRYDAGAILGSQRCAGKLGSGPCREGTICLLHMKWSWQGAPRNFALDRAGPAGV
jgi:hypothetical protein